MESTLQKPHRHRPGQWPWRPRQRRAGADAAFAKAIARAEFGRFYTDDAREQEVARSLAQAKTRRKSAAAAEMALPVKESRDPPAKGSSRSESAPQTQLSPRERRTERAEAMARIAAAAMSRKERNEGR